MFSCCNIPVMSILHGKQTQFDRVCFVHLFLLHSAFVDIISLYLSTYLVLFFGWCSRFWCDDMIKFFLVYIFGRWTILTVTASALPFDYTFTTSSYSMVLVYCTVDKNLHIFHVKWLLNFRWLPFWWKIHQSSGLDSRADAYSTITYICVSAHEMMRKQFETRVWVKQQTENRQSKEREKKNAFVFVSISLRSLSSARE